MRSLHDLMMDVIQTSSGRVYPQLDASIDESSDDWPSPTTCLFPTSEQVDTMASLLSAHNISSVASIGCGEGACEAMLESRGLIVHAVDLDVLSNVNGYKSMRCFCKEIRRVRPDEIFLIPEPEHTALCFFWGRALPWRAYLAHYPQIQIVVIAGEPVNEGEDCATDPRGGALDGMAGWRLCLNSPVRACHRGASLTIYERVLPGMALRAGSHARISGLQARADLNGQEAALLSRHGERWAVRLIATNEGVKIKESNLTPESRSL